MTIDEQPTTVTSAASDDTVVRLDGVGKQFDDTWVLRDIDLAIPAGTVHGMIGPSGCGKTTTVRLLLGYHRPDEGNVEVLGADPVTRKNRERKQVGYLPQHPVLFDELSLWQNLQYHAALVGVRRDRSGRLDEVLELVDLASDRDKRVSEASGGMKRRLALAATLVSDPPLLMLDEPTAGVDPILRRQLWDEFRNLRDQGSTLVVTTQFVEEAAYCDRVSVLAGGALRAEGSPDDLIGLAYGGQRLDIQLDQVVGGPVVAALQSVDGIADAMATGPRSVRIAVASSHVSLDANDPIDPELRRAVEQAAGDAEIASVSGVTVDWNDVFVEVVENDGPTLESGASDTTEDDA